MAVQRLGMTGKAPSSLICWRTFCAVVGLVGGDGERRSRRVQNLFDDLAVMDLSARHDEVQRPAFAVDDRVDFRGAAAPADADRLILLPPFAPLAAR